MFIKMLQDQAVLCDISIMWFVWLIFRGHKDGRHEPAEQYHKACNMKATCHELCSRRYSREEQWASVLRNVACEREHITSVRTEPQALPFLFKIQFTALHFNNYVHWCCSVCSGLLSPCLLLKTLFKHHNISNITHKEFTATWPQSTQS